MRSVQAVLTTFVIAVVSGVTASFIGVVLPWLLGPLLALLIVKLWKPNIALHWPALLRSVGLLILGIQLGSAFTKQAAAQMGVLLPYMMMTTLILIGFSVGLALLYARHTGVSKSTALLGSFPGGLSQMVIVAEELEETNESLVAFMQTFRILLVILVVPLIAYAIYGDNGSGATSDVNVVKITELFVEPSMLLVLVIGMPIGIILGKKIGLPIPYLLVPMLLVAVGQIAGIPADMQIPGGVTATAQLLLGAHLGVSMRLDKSMFTWRIIRDTVFTNISLIVACLAIAGALSKWFGFSFRDSFLSVAPGGVTEMSITAIAIDGDLAIVTSFHLFRIFFILLVVTPLLKRYMQRKQIRNLSPQ
ncbi:AbrB family transcriptional regulator [Bacillus fonticola]|uniref:AbrB family transcriptional regulator n=1 Tax=Bacillus fonticola TaxID=2728853 RepID=UPI00147352E9|nr:AbrB family transcriptional regulator [Bacillus fonticola]